MSEGKVEVPRRIIYQLRLQIKAAKAREAKLRRHIERMEATLAAMVPMEKEQ